MSLKIVNVTVNTADPKRLAEWWAAALGGAITADWGDYVMVGAEGTGIAFQRVEGTSPGRVHVDLAAEDAPAEVRRLIDSGATHVADHEVPEGDLAWTVLADPDGNEFCVTQSSH